MVWALSLVLLVLVLVKSIINHDKASMLMENYGTKLEASVANETDKLYDSSMALDWLVNFSANWFKDWLADILVYILGLCLVYFVMKMSVKSGTWIGFVDDKLNKLMDNTGKFLSNLPIIPVWWWKAVWRSVLSDAVQRKPWDMLQNKKLEQSAILENDERFKWLFPNNNSWKLFSTLDITSKRDVFIENAYNIAKTKNLIMDKSPWINDKDGSLALMLDKWNDNHKNPVDKINGAKQILEDYKPPKES